MKSLCIFLLCLFASIITVQAQNTDPDLIVHEWGTFTSMYGSTGEQLMGMNLEEEELPDFVRSHFGVQPHVSAFWFRDKEDFGYYNGNTSLNNVSVKMETPVIYFYTHQAKKVSVRVDFPNGSISQWFPDRADGEPTMTAPNYFSQLDFSQPYHGWISWDVQINAPGFDPTYPPARINTWLAPRQTDANTINGTYNDYYNGNVLADDIKNIQEKFLFYRGFGNSRCL